MKKLKWGILGPGKIANKFAEALRHVEGVELYAVASRHLEHAKSFASKHNAAVAYGNYSELVNDPQVDVIYVATPHAFHGDHTVLCLTHKKPVLCEKPLAHKYSDVQNMVASARQNQVFLMEAMWTRFLPAIEKALALIQHGDIGEVVELEADFGFNAPVDLNGRLYNMELGGGSLLDVGVYPLFLALTVLGKPIKIESQATLAQTGADTLCTFQLHYTHAIAKLKSAILEDTPRSARIKGTKGSIEFVSPWYHPTDLILRLDTGEIKKFDFGYQGNGFEMQIREVKKCLENNKLESDIMPHAFSLLQSEVLDIICAQCKIVYP